MPNPIINIRAVLINTAITIAMLVNAFKSRVLADGGTFEAENYLLNQRLGNINAASFVYVPSAFKAGKDYVLKPTNGSGDLTHARSSVAYRNNSSNGLEQMSSNIGRIHYINGVPTLLMEPARTNLISFSENYTDASWSKGNCIITANAGIAPTGSNTAQLFNEGSTSANHTLSKGGITFVAGNYIIYQVIKAVNRNFVGLGSVNANIGNIFNLTNNTVTSNLLGGSLTNPFCIDHPSGNGWKIIGGQTNNPNNISFFIFAAINGTTVNYQGTNQDCYLLAGSQCELGTFMSSYILTTIAAVTRVGDAVFNSNATSFIGQDAGTIVVNYRPYAFGVSAARIVVSTDDALNNRIWLSYNTNNTITCFMRNSSGVIYNANSTALQINGLNKIAIAYANGDIRIYLNGALILSSSGAMVFGQPRNNLFIGSAETTNDFNQIYIDSCYAYMTSLPNSQCINLTT